MHAVGSALGSFSGPPLWRPCGRRRPSLRMHALDLKASQSGCSFPDRMQLPRTDADGFRADSSDVSHMHAGRTAGRRAASARARARWSAPPHPHFRIPPPCTIKRIRYARISRGMGMGIGATAAARPHEPPTLSDMDLLRAMRRGLATAEQIRSGADLYGEQGRRPSSPSQRTGRQDDAAPAPVLSTAVAVLSMSPQGSSRRSLGRPWSNPTLTPFQPQRAASGSIGPCRGHMLCSTFLCEMCFGAACHTSGKIHTGTRGPRPCGGTGTHPCRRVSPSPPNMHTAIASRTSIVDSRKFRAHTSAPGLISTRSRVLSTNEFTRAARGHRALVARAPFHRPGRLKSNTLLVPDIPGRTG